MINIGWFASSHGKTSKLLLKAVHKAIDKGDLPAKIAVVFCDRSLGENENSDQFHAFVRSCGYPLVTLSYRDYRKKHGSPFIANGVGLPDWRTEYDKKVIDLLREYPFDVGIMAGYMLISSELMCDEYNIINLHPAAPGGPSGSWQDVIWELIANGAQESGVMMHLVTPELDSGPVVTYCKYPIVGKHIDHLWNNIDGRDIGDIRASEGESNALFSEISRLGVIRELPLLVSTIASCANRSIVIDDGTVVDEDGHLSAGLDLTENIEQLLNDS